MIRVTAGAFHEKVQINEEEVVLNGPPGYLRGSISIGNNADEILVITEVPLSNPTQGKTRLQAPETFKFNTSLQPGEKRLHNVLHQLHPQTPPGVYESIIHIGGKQKKLKMVVQPTIKISIYPLTFHFQGVVPGKSYRQELLMTNKGNVAVSVPDIKHGTLLDLDYLCRAQSMAIREKGNEGFMATLDQIVKNIHKDMAGWAIVKLDESGKMVEPGAVMTLHFSVTLPENVDPRRDYSGDVRLWDKVISYVIKSQ